MKKIFYFISVVLVLSSCEKVIDIDLNDSAPRTVIEAIIDNSGNPATVKLSTTRNFDESNTFPPVTGAFITIHNQLGELDTLKEEAPGHYKGSSLLGKEGDQYTLNVVLLDGSTFTAQSTMPYRVNLDSVRVDSINFGGDYQITLYPQLFDPAGIVNYYRFKIIKNGVPNKNIFLQDDLFSDGIMMLQPLIDPEADIEYYDTVDLEMMCVDKNVFKYWYSLYQTVTQETAAPANPVSNLNNEALGYFSAQTYQVRRVPILP